MSIAAVTCWIISSRRCRRCRGGSWIYDRRVDSAIPLIHSTVGDCVYLVAVDAGATARFGAARENCVTGCSSVFTISGSSVVFGRALSPGYISRQDWRWFFFFFLSQTFYLLKIVRFIFILTTRSTRPTSSAFVSFCLLAAPRIK